MSDFQRYWSLSLIITSQTLINKSLKPHIKTNAIFHQSHKNYEFVETNGENELCKSSVKFVQAFKSYKRKSCAILFGTDYMQLYYFALFYMPHFLSYLRRSRNLSMIWKLRFQDFGLSSFLTILNTIQHEYGLRNECNLNVM